MVIVCEIIEYWVLKMEESVPLGSICCFCLTSYDDEALYGKFYKIEEITTHYFCLLLSSKVQQRGSDSEGILGFLPQDIRNEVRRGKNLSCTYCGKRGATLSCHNSKCRLHFHLPCGRTRDTFHEFFGEFKSFCCKHRKSQRIKQEVLKAMSGKQSTCSICLESVPATPSPSTLWAPCCSKDAWFHRICIQRLALSAGYFFKCPLCNNTTQFVQSMRNYGIWIPEQDASWERDPDRYEGLLQRHNSCDARICRCKNGRTHHVPDTKWEIKLCGDCGSQGMHVQCGNLRVSQEWICTVCSNVSAEDGHKSFGKISHSREAHLVRNRQRRNLPERPSCRVTRQRQPTEDEYGEEVEEGRIPQSVHSKSEVPASKTDKGASSDPQKDDSSVPVHAQVSTAQTREARPEGRLSTPQDENSDVEILENSDDEIQHGRAAKNERLLCTCKWDNLSGNILHSDGANICCYCNDWTEEYIHLGKSCSTANIKHPQNLLSRFLSTLTAMPGPSLRKGEPLCQLALKSSLLGWPRDCGPKRSSIPFEVPGNERYEEKKWVIHYSLIKGNSASSSRSSIRASNSSEDSSRLSVSKQPRNYKESSRTKVKEEYSSENCNLDVKCQQLSEVTQRVSMSSYCLRSGESSSGRQQFSKRKKKTLSNQDLSVSCNESVTSQNYSKDGLAKTTQKKFFRGKSEPTFELHESPSVSKTSSTLSPRRRTRSQSRSSDQMNSSNFSVSSQISSHVGSSAHKVASDKRSSENERTLCYNELKTCKQTNRYQKITKGKRKRSISSSTTNKKKSGNNLKENNSQVNISKNYSQRKRTRCPSDSSTSDRVSDSTMKNVKERKFSGNTKDPKVEEIWSMAKHASFQPVVVLTRFNIRRRERSVSVERDPYQRERPRGGRSRRDQFTLQKHLQATDDVNASCKKRRTLNTSPEKKKTGRSRQNFKASLERSPVRTRSRSRSAELDLKNGISYQKLDSMDGRNRKRNSVTIKGNSLLEKDISQTVKVVTFSGGRPSSFVISSSDETDDEIEVEEDNLNQTLASLNEVVTCESTRSSDETDDEIEDEVEVGVETISDTVSSLAEFGTVTYEEDCSSLLSTLQPSASCSRTFSGDIFSNCEKNNSLVSDSTLMDYIYLPLKPDSQAPPRPSSPRSLTPPPSSSSPTPSLSSSASSSPASSPHSSPPPSPTPVQPPPTPSSQPYRSTSSLSTSTSFSHDPSISIPVLPSTSNLISTTVSQDQLSSSLKHIPPTTPLVKSSTNSLSSAADVPLRRSSRQSCSPRDPCVFPSTSRVKNHSDASIEMSIRGSSPPPIFPNRTGSLTELECRIKARTLTARKFVPMSPAATQQRAMMRHLQGRR